jgi:hypothetical protein
MNTKTLLLLAGAYLLYKYLMNPATTSAAPVAAVPAGTGPGGLVAPNVPYFVCYDLAGNPYAWPTSNGPCPTT